MSKPSPRAPGARLACRHIPVERPVPSLADDARRGLLERPRSLPPKYFYDEYGSWLFDRICDTPEYYPTRAEDSLLAQHAGDVIAAAAPRHLCELGSGASRKTRHLLDACQDQGHTIVYWPFDVCEEIMLDCGRRLLADYPWLSVHALVGDYAGGLAHLPTFDGPCLYAFLGGTIGNFEHAEGVVLLTDVRRRMGPDDYFLIGADRVKDRAVLEAAYNDAEGVTAAFNLNLLNILNRELDARFDRRGFVHRALYNETACRIEMYLEAVRAQSVLVGGLDTELTFEANERILTEISRKFTPEGLTALLGEAGFTVDRHFEPESGWFSLVLARPA